MLPYSSGVDKDKGRKEYQVALQKAVTQKLMTPGSRFAGLKGQTGGKFDGVSTVLNDKPAVLVQNVKFQDGANSFGKEGYVPNTIQLGGTTLYGLQQGNNVVFSPKTKTPLMESFKPQQKPPEDDGDDKPLGPPSPSTDPRNADYLTARGKLTKDSTAEEIKKVEDIGMTAWAKANPGLAAKVKPGQSGYDQSQDVLVNSTQDQRDLASDMGVMGVNPEERMARAKGGIVEVDIDGSGVGPARISPQGFKDDAMTALLTNFGNTNVEPFVEGMTLPTTTNYAAAFNQADTPDLQSMMNMGDQLGNYGIESPLFSQGQKFKDLFQNAMLGK
jgi:hypothetical protein